MRILYLIDRLGKYGSELLLLQLAQYFNKTDQVKIIALKNGPLAQELLKAKIEFEVIETGWLKIILNIFQLSKAVKGFAPDIIHSHQPKALLTGSILGSLLKIPSVITLLSAPVDYAFLYANWIKKITAFLFHAMVQFLSELLSRKIIYLNRLSLEKSCFKNKAVMIQLWLNPALEGQCKEKLILDECLHIVTVGAISQRKGYDILLKFLALLHQRGRNFKATILGDGEARYVKHLKKIAEENNIIEKVEFAGYVDPIEFYKKADVFVLFSRHEVVGLVYIEAMAYGLPVFAKKLKTLEEFIPSWNFLSDNIEELVSGLGSMIAGGQYLDISNRNYAYAKSTFNYQDRMLEYADLYEGLIKNPLR